MGQMVYGDVPTVEKIQQSVSDNGYYLPGGVIGSANNLISQTFSKQASGVQYLALIKDNILGKPVYAQGVGFVGLEPLLPIWRGFRNVVYLLSTVYFVVLGIMVMFRLKLNPQTILTAQSAVPQVIVTLLLVTFSYAIAGLLIDLSYLIQNIVLVLFFQIQGKNLNQNLFSEIAGVGGLTTLTKQFSFRNLTDATSGDLFRLASLALPKNLLFLLGTMLGALIFGLLGFFVGAGVGTAVGAGSGLVLGGTLLIFILGIIVSINLGKLFFGLAKTYINILLKIILAPLEIGLGAIPGMKTGFSSWVSGLFANILVFPICLLFLVLINLIIEKVSFTSSLWTPSLIKSNPTGILITILGAYSGGFVPAIIGFMSLLMLSKLPDMITQVFFSMKPSGMESMIGKQTEGVFANLNKTAKGAGNIVFTTFGDDALDALSNKINESKKLRIGLGGRQSIGGQISDAIDNYRRQRFKERS